MNDEESLWTIVISVLALVVVIALLVIFTKTPEIPEPFVVLKTGNEVKAYITEDLGLVCDESKGYEWWTTSDYPLPVDEFGYYGYRATTPWEEETGAGGEMVFVVRLDPNNGWIQQLTCNSDYIDNCPERIFRSVEENPNYPTYLELPIGTGVRIVSYLTFEECRGPAIE